jgi:hypothetical protein
MADTGETYWTNVAAPGADDAPAVRRFFAAVDRIEALAERIAADRDEMQARLSAACLFLDFAINAATSALDGYDHRQKTMIHDGIVEALAHLRTLQKVLAGTAGTPPSKEAPSRPRIRRH